MYHPSHPLNTHIHTRTQDLDKERERRWKAEQAAERLVEHVRTLQTKLADVQAKHELCVVQNSRLNSKVTGVNQNKETLKCQLDELRGQLEDSSTELDKMHTRDAEQMDLLRRLEENCRSLETEKIKDLTELSSRTKEAERRAAGCAREVELLTKSVRHLKAQLHQTQEMLANREREHQKQMENCKPLESKEVLYIHYRIVYIGCDPRGNKNSFVLVMIIIQSPIT